MVALGPHGFGDYKARKGEVRWWMEPSCFSQEPETLPRRRMQKMIRNTWLARATKTADMAICRINTTRNARDFFFFFFPINTVLFTYLFIFKFAETLKLSYFFIFYLKLKSIKFVIFNFLNVKFITLNYQDIILTFP